MIRKDDFPLWEVHIKKKKNKKKKNPLLAFFSNHLFLEH